MKYATVLLATVATVSAHSTWQELWVGSEDKAGTCVRTVKDNSPVTGLTNPDMFCGRGPASTSGVCEVAGTSPRLHIFTFILGNVEIRVECTDV
jgi:cellulase